MHDTPRGCLKINAPLSFGALHISPLLDEFVNLYPEVQIDLNFDDHKIDMVKNGFDITVRITKQLEGNFFARKPDPCHQARGFYGLFRSDERTRVDRENNS
ncbi:MAG: DNA-binding transcriptional LysR family regulator [Arenicella sp.]